VFDERGAHSLTSLILTTRGNSLVPQKHVKGAAAAASGQVVVPSLAGAVFLLLYRGGGGRNTTSLQHTGRDAFTLLSPGKA